MKGPGEVEGKAKQCNASCRVACDISVYAAAKVCCRLLGITSVLVLLLPVKFMEQKKYTSEVWAVSPQGNALLGYRLLSAPAVSVTKAWL